jgi:membrane protein DedA with SNARE-associated domain
MSDQLLALVSQYGAPALFGIAAVAAVGVPLPVTLLLILAGSMIAQGAMHPWLAVAAAGAGSILGDQAGYAVGRWGGQALVNRVSGMFGKRASLSSMEAQVRAWGGPSIFLTRWLMSPLGPWINLASGTASYPWHRFLFWDMLGEMTGAALYISLGRYFSDRVIALSGMLGDMTWAIVALAAALILGYQLLRTLRRRPAGVRTETTL